MPDPSPDGASDGAAPSPERPDAASAPRGTKRAGRIGRRVALLVWALGMSYIVVVGFVTLIPQVFMREAPTSPRASAFEGDCDDAVAALSGSLLERGGEHVAEALPAATLAPFFRRWDGRFHAYQRRCGETASGADLARLRYRIELTLRRFDREEGAIVRRLDGHGDH